MKLYQIKTLNLRYKYQIILGTILLLFVNTTAISIQLPKSGEEKLGNSAMKTEKEWKGCLTPEEYRILREKGTEMAFSGKYNKHKEEGVYKCAGCGEELFSSETKYDSGSGWPSFWQPISKEKISTETDKSFFMSRTEILCKTCGGHLGHVFDDGPQPSGLRYCVNSVSLDFESKNILNTEKQGK
tara:strand:+ start:4660 stop:5214 length:555 start_codon:yes stop_codon:yes gene_type:complete